jgi:hypothetical protein
MDFPIETAPVGAPLRIGREVEERAGSVRLISERDHPHLSVPVCSYSRSEGFGCRPDKRARLFDLCSRPRIDGLRVREHPQPLAGREVEPCDELGHVLVALVRGEAAATASRAWL